MARAGRSGSGGLFGESRLHVKTDRTLHRAERSFVPPRHQPVVQRLIDPAGRSFRTWLQENPAWGWGWIGWADNYLFAPPTQRNLTRAEQILQEGLAVDGIEERNVFYERLEHLYEEQGRKQEAAKMRASLKKFNPEVLHSPITPIKRTSPKVGRNDPCPCGSGRKFKKCCGA